MLIDYAEKEKKYLRSHQNGSKYQDHPILKLSSRCKTNMKVTCFQDMRLCEDFVGACSLYLQDRWHKYTHISILESWIRRFWDLMFICTISLYLRVTRSGWAVCAKERSFQLSHTQGISILLQAANILYRQAERRLGGLDDGSFTACSTATSNWKRELQVRAIAPCDRT